MLTLLSQFMWPWLFLFLSEYFIMFRFLLARTQLPPILVWFLAVFLPFFPLHVYCFCLYFSFGRILNMHILSYFLIATFSSRLNSYNCWCLLAVHLSLVVLVCFGFILSGICLFVCFLSFHPYLVCFACSSLKPCLTLEGWVPWFLITSRSGLSLQEIQTKRRSILLLKEHVTTFKLNFHAMVTK